MTKDKVVLKIGEVARLNKVSTDTLRYYSKIGIFKEDYVDENGYRFYYVENLVNLDLIIWLRMNDMPLEDIKEILISKSLDTAIDYFEKHKQKLKAQIEQLTEHWKNCRYYHMEMSLVREMKPGECSLVPYDARYYLQSKETVPTDDHAAFELGLKRLMNESTNKSDYYNTFFGGVFMLDACSGDGYKSDMHVATFSILDRKNKDGLPLPAGIYAVMPITGYFHEARKQLPLLLNYIARKGYRPCSHCFVLKIWETNRSEKGELTEIQILVEKE